MLNETFSVIFKRCAGAENKRIYCKVLQKLIMLDLIQSLSSRNGFGAEAENGNAKAQQITDDLQEFDEKLRTHRPDHDKAIIRRSFFISTLRVSWNLIEAEILHNPGNLQANAQGSACFA